MRILQSTYWLEPAGSHGVWGLDDYHFLPFLFGSAQLRGGQRHSILPDPNMIRGTSGHKYIRPKAIHDPEIVEEYSKDYIYFACIAFINSARLSPSSLSAVDIDALSLMQIKTASLRWHSPMLNDISAVSFLPPLSSFPPGHFLFISQVKTWDKVNSGMLKMYLAEVLNKLPVIQHFLFGSFLPYDGPLPPPPPPATSLPSALSTSSKPVISHTVHGDHVHAHDDLGGAGQKDVGWGDCCGIPVPSVFAAARAEAEKKHGLKLGEAGVPGVRPVPFD